MMTQVDPLMPNPGGVGLMGLGTSVVGVRSKPNQLLLGKGLESNTVAPMALQAQMQQQQQQQQQQHHLHHQQQQQQLHQQQPQQQHQHHSQMGLGMILSGMSQDPSQLSALKAQHATVPAVGSHHGGPIASANPGLSLQGVSQFGAPSYFQTGQDRLPTDLDIDMFTENLDCDVDYIINSDLMDGDGLDFDNFDPILPGGQGYAGPATTQGSAHSWVPS
ncbi:forkhead box protein O3-like [Micropterus salmoides]|uniref:forkhead box protein O3-like n=1 Tax=Micropterus salmoides TaxID=27706 RepID=UPI0018EE2DE4|nr:forkhead box protein O3-like [Micropterus salmoides]